MGARLIGAKGVLLGRSIELRSGEAIIGREPVCSIPLVGDQTVGRRHARIIESGSDFLLEDLGSQNGTFLNEVRITGQASLRNGDTIRIGGQVLQFELEPGVSAIPSMPTGVRKAEVSRGEGPAAFPAHQVGDGPGCALPNFTLPDIDLAGCLRRYWLILVILLILCFLLFVAMLLGSGVLAMLGAGAHGGTSGGSSGSSGGGSSGGGGGSGGQDQPSEQSRTGIQVIEAKVDFAKRPGFGEIKPVVLVTWRNQTNQAVSEITAEVTCFDAAGRVAGIGKKVIIYRGAEVAEGETHTDTVQDGGWVFQPDQGTSASGDVVRTAKVRVLEWK